MLDGFGNVFGVIRRKPSVIIPSVFGVSIILVINLIIFEYAKTMNFSNISWIPFALTVFNWSIVFTLSGWTALLIEYESSKSEKMFSKAFTNLFVFSTFMSFFSVAGFELYVLPGIVVLFFMLYTPSYIILNNDTDALNGFKENLKFILDDAHIIHTLVSLFILMILLVIPYVGEYLAAFFYILWIPNIYISEKREEIEEDAEEM